jgi:hypothetical protein
MQHAGQMARAFRALIGKEDAPPTETIDNYMKWANVVLRVASMLLPYQRPAYRSIEVHTDKGVEERATRFVGDPAERLAQIVVGAIIAQPDVVVPPTRPQDAPADAGGATTEPQAAAEPVDNGDGRRGHRHGARLRLLLHAPRALAERAGLRSRASPNRAAPRPRPGGMGEEILC